MTAEQFSHTTGTIFTWTLYVISGISALIGLSGLLFVVVQKQYNFLLIAYCTILVGDAVTYVLMTYYSSSGDRTAF